MVRWVQFHTCADVSNEAVGVALAAPPRDGEANEELLSFMTQVCLSFSSLSLLFFLPLTIGSRHHVVGSCCEEEADGAGQWVQVQRQGAARLRPATGRGTRQAQETAALC